MCDNCFCFREPFDPKVVLTSVANLFSVDTKTGGELPRIEPCLVCVEQLSEEAYQVVINNGEGDMMEVGYCCKKHDCLLIAQKTIDQAIAMLEKRAQAVADFRNGGMKVVIEA